MIASLHRGSSHFLAMLLRRAGWFWRGAIALCLALVSFHGAVAAGKKENPPPKAIPKKAQSDPTDAAIGLLEAVRWTLSRSPRIQLESKQVEISRGTALARSGAFDLRLQGNGSHGVQRQEALGTPPAPTPTSFLPLTDLTTGETVPGVAIVVPGQTPAPGPAVSKVNSSSFDVGVVKPLRNGAEVSSQAVYSRQNTGADGPIANISELRLNLKVPVLRAFQPSDAAMVERASKIDYAASLLAERHVITESIFRTARAYWLLRAAQERLDLTRRSEATALSIREIMGLLIGGDERARSEIHLVDARVSETKARRVSAEQGVYEGRQQLGLAMGLDSQEVRLSPLAAEPFPETRGLSRARTKRDQLIIDALQLRADYRASLTNEQSAATLLNAARLNLRPRMDFQLRTSYFGGELGARGENLSGSFFGNQTGASVIGMLSLDWPLQNREARGLVLRSGAQLDQAEIRSADLKRNVVSGVIVSINALVQGSSQLEHAQSAVEAYEQALDTERQKYQGGVTTLLDLIAMEDRLLDGLSNAIGAKQQIAEGYARLRFETGTMFTGDGYKVTLRNDALVTFPHAPGEIPLASIPGFRAQARLR